MTRIKCLTPTHVIKISQECFEKYLSDDIFGEHSLIFCHPHTASALCMSNQCQLLLVMQAAEFAEFLKTISMTNETLCNMASWREFQKTIVFKTKKSFLSNPKDLQAAFDAANKDSSGFLSLDNVQSMLRQGS